MHSLPTTTEHPIMAASTVEGYEDVRLRQQRHAFTMWVNSALQRTSAASTSSVSVTTAATASRSASAAGNGGVRRLEESLADGVTLVQLVEALTGERVSCRPIPNPSSR
jgi:hypothetical protein